MSMHDQDDYRGEADVPRDMGAVGVQMQAIDNTIQRLKHAINEHESVVNPVLRGEGPTQGEKDATVTAVPNISSHAGNLDSINQQVNALAVRLEEITRRVDL